MYIVVSHLCSGLQVFFPLFFVSVSSSEMCGLLEKIPELAHFFQRRKIAIFPLKIFNFSIDDEINLFQFFDRLIGINNVLIM